MFGKGRVIKYWMTLLNLPAEAMEKAFQKR
jgi:hypothetical protein